MISLAKKKSQGGNNSILNNNVSIFLLLIVLAKFDISYASDPHNHKYKSLTCFYVDIYLFLDPAKHSLSGHQMVFYSLHTLCSLNRVWYNSVVVPL